MFVFARGSRYCTYCQVFPLLHTLSALDSCFLKPSRNSSPCEDSLKNHVIPPNPLFLFHYIQARVKLTQGSNFYSNYPHFHFSSIQMSELDATAHSRLCDTETMVANTNANSAFDGMLQKYSSSSEIVAFCQKIAL